MDLMEKISYLTYSIGKVRRYFLNNRCQNDLSPAEEAVIWAINQSRGEALYPSQLSTIMGIKRPSLTPVLHAMVERGLVERKPDPYDARRYQIAPTPLCDEVRRLHRLQRRRLFESILDQIGEEDSDKLVEIMQKVEAAIDKQALGGKGEDNEKGI